MVKYFNALNQLGGFTEYAEFNGVKYYFFKNGYYKRTNRPYTLLHHDIWKYHGHEIPKGYELHHKDHDKKNNTITNFELLTKSEHAKLHQKETIDKAFNCVLCGNVFYSRVTHNKVKYCKTCRTIHEKKIKSQWAKNNRLQLNRKSLENYHSKIYNEKRNCLHCGKVFSTIKSSPQKYCSRSCVATATNKTKKGDKYNNCKSMFICPVCGNKYETYISGRNHKQTCSLECSYKHRFKKSIYI